MEKQFLKLYFDHPQGEPGAQGRSGPPGPPGRFIAGPKVTFSLPLSNSITSGFCMWF